MPRYDMKCSVCQKVLEVFCPIDLRHSQVCPRCGTPLQIAYLKAPGIHFVGGGWPTADSKREGNLVSERRKVQPRFDEQNREAVKKSLQKAYDNATEVSQERIEHEAHELKREGLADSAGMRTGDETWKPSAVSPRA